MKTSFQRLPPKIRHYRDYSNYSNIMFRVSLFNELSKLNIEAIDLHKFITVYIGTLNNHAPSKKKYIRDNHLPFMNKELSEKIMHKKRLWKNFLTLFPLRYLGPLYHFGGGEVKLPPTHALVFSRSTRPIYFKLGKYLTHQKYSQNKSKWYPRSRDFLMTSSYFVKFSEILMKFQFEITFDVKNYFLLLLRFL